MEVVDAKTPESLTTNTCMSVPSCGDRDALDAKMARGLTNSFNGNFQEQVALEEQKDQALHRILLTGRQNAFMMFDHFKFSDAAGAALDIGDLCFVLLVLLGTRQFSRFRSRTSESLYSRRVSAQQTVGKMVAGERNLVSFHPGSRAGRSQQLQQVEEYGKKLSSTNTPTRGHSF